MDEALAQYSGDTGAYVCVVPTEASTKILFRMVSHLVQLGMPAEATLVPNDFHCTIMYSEYHAPTPNSIPYLNPETKIGAYLWGLDAWDGHNGKGHVVARLRSPVLQKLEKFWQSLGCVPSFTPYKPHITLVADFKSVLPELPAPVVTYIKECNQYLSQTPLKITLFGHRIEDIS